MPAKTLIPRDPVVSWRPLRVVVCTSASPARRYTRRTVLQNCSRGSAACTSARASRPSDRIDFSRSASPYACLPQADPRLHVQAQVERAAPSGDAPRDSLQRVLVTRSARRCVKNAFPTARVFFHPGRGPRDVASCVRVRDVFNWNSTARLREHDEADLPFPAPTFLSNLASCTLARGGCSCGTRPTGFPGRSLTTNMRGRAWP